MRRKDKEVPDRQEILDILRRCDTIRIAMHGGDYPYVVPVSFGMEIKDDTVVLYFHCAVTGLKKDLIEQDPRVCVEGDIFIGTELTSPGITARYESVIGFGTCSFVSDPEEIMHGLKLLTEHYGQPDYPLAECIENCHLLVGKIVLEEITGKRSLPKGS